MKNTTKPLGDDLDYDLEQIKDDLTGRNQIAFQAEDGRPVLWAKPTNKWQLKKWIEWLFGLKMAHKAVCPGHSAPLDALAASYFAISPVVLWYASRGFGGKTTGLSTLSMLELMDGANVNVLGGSGRQSQRVNEAVSEAWNRKVEWKGDYFRHPLRSIVTTEPTTYHTTSKYGNRIIALTASQASVRGPHPQRLRLDEVDEIDWPIYEAAMGQAMSSKGISAQTTLSSTLQYSDGTFNRVLNMAAERGWPIYRWCVAPDTKIATPRGDIEIANIKKGESVYAWQDGKFVISCAKDVWCSGTRDTVVVKTDRGSIRCTSDHRVLTENGWKEAGSLAANEQIYCMQRMQSEISSSRQEQDRTLPDMQGQEQYGQDMPQVSRAKTGIFKAMSILSFNISSWTKQTASWNDGISSGTSEKQDEAGTRSGRIIRFVRYQIRRASQLWTLCDRFRITRTQGRDRGQQRLLAQSAGADREGYEKKVFDGRQRFYRGKPLGQSDAYLVLAVVQGVESSTPIDVWDMTVPDGHSFIANGHIVHNCWRESSVRNDGWLTDDEVRDKQKTVTRRMWNIEYDLEKPRPVDAILDIQKVEQVFSMTNPIADEPGIYYEYEEPVEDGKYITSADWARDEHYTVIVTLREDVFPMKLVAYERVQQGLSYPALVKKFDDRCKRYPGRYIHDATGLGAVIEDLIKTPGVTNYKVNSKEQAYGPYILAVEKEDIEGPYYESLVAEHQSVTNKDIYGSGHPPDGFVAMALGWLMHINRHIKGSNPGQVMTPITVGGSRRTRSVRRREQMKPIRDPRMEE